MQDNTLVILGLVGLALVCAGLFLFVGLTLFRATGHRLLGFFALLARDAGDERNAQPYAQSTMPNLRAIAEAQDFDSALARHGAESGQDIPPVETASPFNTAPTPHLGSRRPTRPELRRDDDDAADLFDALLDEE